MNFLEQLQSKYAPTVFKARQQTRQKQLIEIKKKAIANPNQLDWFETRKILRDLKRKKLLPIDQKSKKLQKQFAIYSTGGLLASIIVATLPTYFIRQYHLMKKWKKFAFVGSIASVLYISMLISPLSELTNYNRSMVNQFSRLLIEQNKQQVKQ